MYINFFKEGDFTQVASWESYKIGQHFTVPRIKDKLRFFNENRDLIFGEVTKVVWRSPFTVEVWYKDY